MESIVNNHPITAVSDDPEDCSALTPNHFLLQKSTQLPRGVFVKEDDSFSRNRSRGAVPCGSLLEEVDTRIFADSSEKIKVGQVKEKCAD